MIFILPHHWVVNMVNTMRRLFRASGNFMQSLSRHLPIILLISGLFMIVIKVFPFSLHIHLPVDLYYPRSSIVDRFSDLSGGQNLKKTSLRLLISMWLSCHNNNLSYFCIRGFLQATKPSDDYIIDLKDVGPRRNTEELFSRVGVSIHNHTQAHMAMEYISAATIAIEQNLFQGLSCFKIGTNMNEIKKMSNSTIHSLKTCPCLQDYYGHQCSIPSCVYKVPENSTFKAFG